MATIHDGDSFTHGLATAFTNAFNALGGEVAAIAAVNKDDTDMSAVLADFAAAEPDGIFLPLFADAGYHFVSQAKAFDGLEEITLIASSAAITREFLGKPESEGVYLSGHDSNFGTNANQATGKDASALSAEHQAATDANFFFHAYDATTLLLSAIESVAVEEGGKLHIDRVALREAIAATTDFQGYHRHTHLRRVRRLRHRAREHLLPCGLKHHGRRAVAGGVPVRAVSCGTPRRYHTPAPSPRTGAASATDQVFANRRVR